MKQVLPWIIRAIIIEIDLVNYIDTGSGQSTFRFESVDTCIICFSLVDRRSFLAVQEKVLLFVYIYFMFCAYSCLVSGFLLRNQTQT